MFILSEFVILLNLFIFFVRFIYLHPLSVLHLISCCSLSFHNTFLFHITLWLLLYVVVWKSCLQITVAFFFLAPKRQIIGEIRVCFCSSELRVAPSKKFLTLWCNSNALSHKINVNHWAT